MTVRNFPDDTIAAISTPLGEGGLGVVRLSGKDAVAVADRIFKAQSGRAVKNQKSFTAQLGRVVQENQGACKIIDEALLLVMRAPKSYTREDVVEISAHGGSAVLKAVLEAAIQNGARLAEKGEFTKRAFLNGRIDLLQAEAVLDLVQAKTDLLREWASEKLTHGLTPRVNAFKKELLDILSHLEASIDFPDDFPETQSYERLRPRLEELLGALGGILKNAEFAVVVKRGFRAALAGRPNVGKSSILNELAKKNRVIVTPFPGTTRDVVEEEIQIRGIPVRLQDTAGIQESADPIEKEGIQRAHGAMAEAELVIHVLDGSRPFELEDERIAGAFPEKAKLIALNKSDLPQKLNVGDLKKKFPSLEIIPCSCVRKDGLAELEESIFKLITHGKSQLPEAPLIGSVRQKELLTKAFQSIADASEGCRKRLSPELVAVDVRLALDELGALTGEVVTDDVLEAIFDQFCIGK